MKKNGRNDNCRCESGKKYKYCCLIYDEKTKVSYSKPGKSLYDKIVDGELPFYARIISQDGETSSMEISNASIIINGQTKTLIDEKITLSTNTTNGDRTKVSAASIQIPIIDSSKGEIKTLGNAQILNEQGYMNIDIQSPKNRIKLKSASGLFAIIETKVQQDRGFTYLSILFGLVGVKEFINNSKRKNRSDVCIYSNGNGKFIRLSDENGDFDPTWEIANEIVYENENKIMYPSSITLASKKYLEKLILNFTFLDGKILMIAGKFV